MSTQIYFELEYHDRYHRADWEERLGGWLTGTAAEVKRVDRPDDADLIVEPSSDHSFIGGRVFSVSPRSHYLQRPDSTFTWDSGDHPTGRLPGLYCSLSRRLTDPRRHRGFCYPLRMNRLVQPCPLTDARYLFGFSGNITAPLRARLFTQLQGTARAGQSLLRQTESIFHRIYSPETDVERARFLDDLRLCRFILCPRGNGLSSIRLFEAMEAARVPVIISDALVLPPCVNWETCAVTVKESQLALIPELLTAREAEWPQLANNARHEWERCFGNGGMLSTLVAQLRSIAATRTRPEKNQRYFFPFHAFPDYGLVRAKALVRKLRAHFRPVRPFGP